jgi:hypothetical protein
MSQWSLLRLADARYGIIHNEKRSSSGMTGGKAWIKENVLREPRFERMRASAARDVSELCRKVSVSRPKLVARVAKVDKPWDVMPDICESVKV